MSSRNCTNCRHNKRGLCKKHRVPARENQTCRWFAWSDKTFEAPVEGSEGVAQPGPCCGENMNCGTCRHRVRGFCQVHRAKVAKCQGRQCPDLSDHFKRNPQKARGKRKVESKRECGSLVFGQYVVGGALATSFIQQSLSNQAVGLLGVIVLISSLIHQTYRPDLQAKTARERLTRLRVLIRHTEDELFAIKSERKDAPSIYDVRRLVSLGLADIEQMELQGFDVASRETETA